MTRYAWAMKSAVYVLLLFSAATARAHIEKTFACYVYIEPYEVRVEFVTTTASLGMPLNFGLDGIDTEEQKDLSLEAGRRLSEVFEIRADGELLDFNTEQVGFVRKEEKDSPVVADRRELIPVHEARISGMFVCANQTPPRSIDVRLKLFDGRPYRPPRTIPVEIEVLTSPTQRASVKLDFTTDDPQQTWVLPPSIKTASLEQTAVPPVPSYLPLYVAGGLCLGSLVIGIAPFWKSRARLAIATIVLVAGVGTGIFSLQRGFSTPIDEQQAESTVQALLSNVYLAFASREESQIFDTLATSVEGPLLETLYLDIQRGLSDAEDGGPSVRVLGVEVLDCEVEASNSERLQARVRWVSSGTVSHWGHAHERQNQYRAQVVAEPIDGSWRLTRVKILEEERIK